MRTFGGVFMPITNQLGFAFIRLDGSFLDITPSAIKKRGARKPLREAPTVGGTGLVRPTNNLQGGGARLKQFERVVSGGEMRTSLFTIRIDDSS